jgi:TPR repeat protein
MLFQTPKTHTLYTEIESHLEGLRQTIPKWKHEFGSDLDRRPPPQEKEKPFQEAADSTTLQSIIGAIHRRIGLHLIANDLLFDIPTSDADMTEAILYHYKMAAEYNCVAAQLALANIYDDKPSGELVRNVLRNTDAALHYARLAAEAGSRIGSLKVALISLERADTDRDDRKDHTTLAVQFLRRALELDTTHDDEESQSFELSLETFDIWRLLAEFLSRLNRHDEASEAYTEAATAAELSGRGKKAMLFYELAEKNRERL